MMDDRILEHYRDEFRGGFDLEPDEAEILIESLIASDRVLLMAELLAAWNLKGITGDELFAMAGVMRGRMQTIDTRGQRCVDIVGTGGSRSKTFNVSTAAAFITAGAGLAVAKHGNRAATSSSGSSDVLTALGINVDVPPAEVQKCFDHSRLCFMFAPRFHSLSPALASARRSLGEPTVFNYLGPLCNPAEVSHQLLGVSDPKMLEPMAEAVARLATERTWIVNGAGSLDEITGAGSTAVIEVADGVEPRRMELTPEDFGLADELAEDSAPRSPEDSAAIVKAILNNELTNGPYERLALVNSAAAIYIVGEANNLGTAFSTAIESIRSGAAMSKLIAIQN